MFSALRSVSARVSLASAFSTSATRRADLAKLTLIGNLIRDPELKQSRNEKEYVVYTVATNSYPPPDVNGERRPSVASYHRVLSFHENPNKYLLTLKKGSKVYVEAGFEIREPEPGADISTPQGQRQIFLRHESIRVLNRAKSTEPSESPEE